jgi:hypothetical protein
MQADQSIASWVSGRGGEREEVFVGILGEYFCLLASHRIANALRFKAQ